MTSKSKLVGGIIVICVINLWAPQIAAQDRASPSEGILLPNASLSAQSDAASLEVNPAGLGFMHSGEATFGWHMPAQALREVAPAGYGLFLAGGNGKIGGGFAFQSLNRPSLGRDLKDYQKYSFGLAVSPADTLAIGAALNLFSSADSQRLDDLSALDLGLQWRPARSLGFALRARDVNQPFLAPGDALPRRYAAAIHLRAFDGRLQLEPEVAVRTGGDSVFLRPRLLLEPVRGVRIFARTEVDVESVNSKTTVTPGHVLAGLELNTSGFGVQGALHIDPDPGAQDPRLAAQSWRAWVGLGKRPGLPVHGPQWVVVNLDSSIVERPTAGLFGSNQRSFFSVVEQLNRFRTDESVDGVVFRIADTSLGWGQAWEIRRQIQALRSAGKTTVGFVTTPDLKGVYLGSAAAALWLTPAAPYDAAGLGLTLDSYQGALNKAGIKAEFVRIGSHKSAPEAFTQAEPSPAALEQTEAFISTVYQEVTRAVAADKSVSVGDFEQAIRDAPVFVEDAIGRGLADDAIYPDEIAHKVAQRGAALTRGPGRAIPGELRFGSRPSVAIVNITGAIVRGASGQIPVLQQDVTGSDSTAELLDQLGRDSSVRAIVLRVDSPGGSAVASDLIYRSVRRLAARKPVVASMGNLAASGGYYVAAGADEIFATPNTLTGSIGIYSGKFSAARLTDFLGVGASRVERGSTPARFSPLESWSDAERDAVSRSITYLYKLFIQQVARTRGMSPAEVDEVARGRIWTGNDALENGLIDRQGGLMDAISRAEELAGLAPGSANYRAYPRAGGLGQWLGTGAKGSWLSRALRGALPMGYEPKYASLLMKRWGQALVLPLVFDTGEALMMSPYMLSED